MDGEFVNKIGSWRGAKLNLPDRLLTPDEFAKAMTEIRASDENIQAERDQETSCCVEADPVSHEMADDLMVHQLERLGYGAGSACYNSWYKDYYTFF